MILTLRRSWRSAPQHLGSSTDTPKNHDKSYLASRDRPSLGRRKPLRSTSSDHETSPHLAVEAGLLLLALFLLDLTMPPHHTSSAPAGQRLRPRRLGTGARPVNITSSLRRLAA